VKIQGKDEVIAGYKLKDEAELHYDARGNMLRIQSEGKNIGEYIYDAANRLIRTTTHTGTVAAYAYDGAGRRVKKEIGGDTYDYMVDMTTPYNDVLYVRHENRHGKTALKYLYGNKLFGAKEAEESSFYLHDEMGSPIRVTDNEGKSHGVTQYDTFGRPNSYGDVRNDVRGLMSFTGYEDDRGTGLMFVQARYYMPELGRFVEEDRNKGNAYIHNSINLYVHCFNNPLKYIDENGCEALEPVYAGLRKSVENAGGAVEWDEGDRFLWIGPRLGDGTITVTYDKNENGTIETDETVVLNEVANQKKYNESEDRNVFYLIGDTAMVDIHELNRLFGYTELKDYVFICYAIVGEALLARYEENNRLQKELIALYEQNELQEQQLELDEEAEVENKGPGELEISLDGLKLLAEMEVNSNSNHMVKEEGELKGIITHDVGDGGLTVGYGFYIKDGMNNTSVINRLKNEYGIIVQEGVMVDIDKVLKLYYESIKTYEDRAKGYINDRGISPTQHEFDALVIQAYNGTYYDVMDAFGDKSLNDAQALEKALQTYRTFKTWNVHGNGWTNRLRNIINLYRHGDYTKLY